MIIVLCALLCPKVVESAVDLLFVRTTPLVSADASCGLACKTLILETC